MEFAYQIVLLGARGARRRRIIDKIHTNLATLGLDRDCYQILEDGESDDRDRKAATAAIFFGFDGAVNQIWPEVVGLVDDTIPIIPVVDALSGYTMKVPDLLKSVNGKSCNSDAEEIEVVTLILENLSLLRKDRRLFISYKRDESTGVAEQLYDKFAAKGFDCFLDTRSVRPSSISQNELWHKLADSDVVILLDTPNFRTSEWTVAELAQANSTSVQILHLLWPDVKADPTSAFSVFSLLKLSNFRFVATVTDRFSTFNDRTVEQVIHDVESLRARAIAARQADLFDSVSDAARETGCNADLHPQRYMTLTCGDTKLAIMPTVGVPSSPRLHGFLTALRHDHSDYELMALYDERGILEEWREHLSWLGQHLPVKTVESGRLLQWLSARTSL